MPGFLLGGFHPLAAAGPDKYTVQRSRMSAAALFLSQLAVQLANADMGITAMAVADPTQFFFRVGIGMLAVGGGETWALEILSCRHTACSGA